MFPVGRHNIDGGGQRVQELRNDQRERQGILPAREILNQSCGSGRGGAGRSGKEREGAGRSGRSGKDTCIVSGMTRVGTRAGRVFGLTAATR
jgi:hypothetical protein